MYEHTRTVRPFGPQMTRLGRQVLVVLVSMYVIQTVLENWAGLPLLQTLAWWSPQSLFFRPWQPLTAFLLNGPDPIEALLSWLLVYFFFTPTEQVLGHRGMVRLFLVAWLTAVLLTFPLLLLGALQPSGPYLGLYCFITAMIVVFGLSKPDATILLFFVLPIRASWFAWGTGLISFLFLLYGRGLNSAVAFFGWVGAVAYMLSGGRLSWFSRQFKRQWAQLRPKRQRGRPEDVLRILDGGRSPRGGNGGGNTGGHDDDDEPLYH